MKGREGGDISYLALEIWDEGDERLLRLMSTTNRREVIAHLRDGWYGLS